MRTSLGQMDGNEWEQYCQRLLRIRYHDYQEVPARFGGDLGIEGLTRSGLVFQCYCPDEDPSGKELYEAQRNKITRDIAKLIRNAERIAALGVNPILEWHFITPRYENRDLLSHCRSKETEVRNRKLATIHPGFRIFIKTEDDYIPERKTFLGTTEHRVQPSSPDPEPPELERFLNSTNQIVQNIKTKLSKLSLNPGHNALLTRQLVNGYIVGQNELENLNNRFPSTYSSIIRLKSATRSQLAILALSCTDPHGAVLSSVLKEYENKLTNDFSETLSSALIARLSTEAISDWLGLCDLDFPRNGGCDANS